MNIIQNEMCYLSPILLRNGTSHFNIPYFATQCKEIKKFKLVEPVAVHLVFDERRQRSDFEHSAKQTKAGLSLSGHHQSSSE